jgi:flagellar biosynthesis protein FlhB
MSEAPDKDSKTEEPTEKKISDAIEKGDVPHSREATYLASLLGIVLILTLLLPERVSAIVPTLARFIDDPGGFRLANANDVIALIAPLGATIGLLLLPFIVVLLLAGLASSMLQNFPRFVSKRIQPQWSRISPFSGFKRIFGAQGQVEFLKSAFKFIAISIVGLILLHWDQYSAINAMFGDPALVPSVMLSIARDQG